MNIGRLEIEDTLTGGEVTLFVEAPYHDPSLGSGVDVDKAAAIEIINHLSKLFNLNVSLDNTAQ